MDVPDFTRGRWKGWPQLGIVTAVNYNFKIKLSEYKRVIALVKTDVHGKFYMAGSHFVTFDPNVLSPAQVTFWFRAPASEEDVYVCGDDDVSFPLDDLDEMGISSVIVPLCGTGIVWVTRKIARSMSVASILSSIVPGNAASRATGIA